MDNKYEYAMSLELDIQLSQSMSLRVDAGRW